MVGSFWWCNGAELFEVKKRPHRVYPTSPHLRYGYIELSRLYANQEANHHENLINMDQR